MASIAKETPAVDNSGSRFGNPAFKTFYDKVKTASLILCVVFATLTKHRRHHLNYIPGYQNYYLILSQRFLFTLRRHGETEREWITAAAWSSIFFAGCESLNHGSEPYLMHYRMCLDSLGILKKDDDVAVVMRVFWK